MLHVYEQTGPGKPLRVLATAEGLEALIAVLQQAKEGQSAEGSATDGGGTAFTIQVGKVSTPLARMVELPYTSDPVALNPATFFQDLPCSTS